MQRQPHGIFRVHKWIRHALLIVLWASPALADQRYSIVGLTEPQLNLIIRALATVPAPWTETNEVLTMIEAQAKDAIKRAQDAAKPDPGPGLGR